MISKGAVRVQKKNLWQDALYWVLLLALLTAGGFLLFTNLGETGTAIVTRLGTASTPGDDAERGLRGDHLPGRAGLLEPQAPADGLLAPCMATGSSDITRWG